MFSRPLLFCLWAADLALAGVSNLDLVPRLFDPALIDVRSLDSLPGLENFTSFLDRRADDSPPPPPSIPGAIFKPMNDYQWDQDVIPYEWPQHTRVVNAWKTMMEMATAARDSLKDFNVEALKAKGEEVQKLDDETRKKKRKLGINDKKLAVRMWIAKQHPAYAQMFSAAIDGDQDWNAPTIIYNRLDTLIKNLEDLNAVGRPRSRQPDEPEAVWHRNGLPLYFTRHENPHDMAGAPLCEGTQAFVILSKDFKEIQDVGGVRPDDNAAIINFCKDFFEMPVTSELLQDLKDGKKTQDEVCDLRKHDTTARVLLHELTHLGWTLNLAPSPDLVGIEYVAQNAIVGGKRTKGDIQTTKFNNLNSGSAEMSDGYARFGIYNFLNSLEECKGIRWNKEPEWEADCTDVWPRDEDKWTKTTWAKYQKEGK